MFKKKIFIFWTFVLLIVITLNYTWATEETTNGITLEFEINNQTNIPNTNTLYDYTLETFVPYYYSDNSVLNQTTYTINFTSNYPYDTKLKILETNDYTNIECESSFANKQCTITYDDTYINTNYYLTYLICNEFESCSLGGFNPFIFSPGNYQKEISSGIKLETIMSFNQSSDTPIHYQSPPTPTNNQNSYQINNFTVSVNLEEKTVNNCILTIDDTNYSMSLNDTHCYYSHSFSESNNILTIDFQAHYNQSGSITSLEQRTINIYPDKQETSKYPAINVLGHLILVVILNMYFIIGGIKK